MEQKIKEFLEEIAHEVVDISNLRIRAKALLNEDFKNEVKKIFKFVQYDNSLKTAIKSGSKIEFLHEVYFREEANNFVKNNFECLDDIIEVLQDYLKENEEAITNEQC